MPETSEWKKLILNLSDAEIRDLLNCKVGGELLRKYRTKSCEAVRWYDKPLRGLSPDGVRLMRELEEDSRKFNSHVDKRQLRYLQTLYGMKLEVPEFYREPIDPKAMYNHLCDFCRENDIPEEIVCQLVPILTSYIRTGRMKGVLFWGDKGCGKSTALRMLSEILKLPVQVISAPQTDRSHGLTGTSGSYQSADCGQLAKGRLKAKQLLLAYIIEEIDKVPHNPSGSSIDDELLSVMDDTETPVVDEYLGTEVVGLQHCPIFLTCNVLERVNPIFTDRLTVIHFPNPDKARLCSVMRKYAEEKLRSEPEIYSLIRFRYDVMERAVCELADRNITSLRRHQQMVDSVLRDAFTRALESSSDTPVETTGEMFEAAVQRILGSAAKSIGF